MTDKLLKILEFVEKIPSIIVCVALLYAYHIFTTDSKPNIVNTDKVTSEVITGENITSDLKETDSLLNNIKDIRNDKVKPNIVLADGVSSDSVQKAVDSLDGDIALSEPITKPGTNIYSIKIRRSPHGIGLYAGIDKDDSTEFEYGIHYRNKRWVYQIGTNANNDFNARVAYELIQW